MLLFIPYAVTGATTPNIQIKIFVTLALTVGASFMSMAVVGFIFAAPQTRPVSVRLGERSWWPNNNLQRVSEWLTGIILGVGLVRFGAIADGVVALSTTIARTGTSGGEGDWPFVASAIVFYAMLGFLSGYLFTASQVRASQLSDRPEPADSDERAPLAGEPIPSAT